MYLKSEETYANDFCTILGILAKQKLYEKFSKCEFWLKSVVFLGHAVSKERVKVDPQKVEAVEDWVQPSSVTEFMSFVGLASYYHHFVRNYSSISTHLTNITEKRYLFNGLTNVKRSSKRLRLF